MLGKVLTVAEVALVMVIGVSLLAAQEVPPPSRTRQLQLANAVEVEVLDAHRKGIHDMSVSLTDEVGHMEAKHGMTDSNGRLRFDDVPDGTYKLVISGPGIEERGSVVFVTPGSRWFQHWLPVIDGKPVKMQSTPPTTWIDCSDCNAQLSSLVPADVLAKNLALKHTFADRLLEFPLPTPTLAKVQKPTGSARSRKKSTPHAN